MKNTLCITFLAVLTSWTINLIGQEPETDPMDGMDWMGIDDLVEVRVITVSKREETVRTVPAAVHVVTSDDIRRSGATSIPEALRMVPGVEVAKVGGSQWAISVRGFNNVYANKLLVLMDGRSVYSPTFAGTYWDTQDTILEDIEQIEVVRGPGGTVWGANAVNGVINIRTKSAKDTQGTLITGKGGTEDRGIVGVRHGFQVGTNVFIRIYGKYLNRDAARYTTGGPSNDSTEQNRGGFRLDWEPDSDHRITLQGDLYDGVAHGLVPVSTTTPPFPSTTLVDRNTGVRGRNVLGRWTTQLSSDGSMYLQSYFDDYERNSRLYRHRVRTVDVDSQVSQPYWERHTATLGAGYRGQWYDVPNSSSLTAQHSSDFLNLFTGFFQNETRIWDDRVSLIMGMKLEHNDFTGFQYQPGGRISSQISPKHTVWTAVSRPVRTPSLVDTDLSVVWSATPGAIVRGVGGGRNEEAEDVTAFEFGWRGKLSPKLTVDTAFYYNRYSHLFAYTTPTLAPPFIPPVAVDNVRINAIEGKTYGGELSLAWDASEDWRLRASYGLIKVDLKGIPSGVTSVQRFEDASPENQIRLQSFYNITDDLDLDLNLRYVDNVEDATAYWATDARLAWRPRPGFEIALVGQNLISPTHQEFDGGADGSPDRVIQRAVYGSITIEF